MSEITRYKLHCGWLYECASYFKPAAIQDDVPMVLASDHDRRVAELEAELAEAVSLLKDYADHMEKRGAEMEEVRALLARHGDKPEVNHE